METIKIGRLTCKLRRAKRKSVAIRAKADGIPEVTAPLRLPEAEIVGLLIKYEEKIREQCRLLGEREASRSEFFVDYGSSVRFFGKSIPVCSEDDEFTGDGSAAVGIPPSLDRDGVKGAVIAVYKRAARAYLTERTAVIADKMGLSPTGVRINSAKSHWASCSRKGSLNFSWYSIMAKVEAIDYIIVHELCHMRYFNHSAEFWAEVERYCPDYRSHRAYLRGLWRDISRENWDM